MEKGNEGEGRARSDGHVKKKELMLGEEWRRRTKTRTQNGMQKEESKIIEEKT